ncbi:hypothetical protein DH2020_007004 [Rehmannia glutinosa]|uniref:RRM domain-containing protein n=1 Tax=Rehmannia glutinosa TaxID=99300 RepID=A0ABR0W5Y7_REHGL
MALALGSSLSLSLSIYSRIVYTFVKYFGKYGEITDSVIMKDRHTGRPRGFGFITYADPSVVDTVIAETHIINGKQYISIPGVIEGTIVGPACVTFSDPLLWLLISDGTFISLQNVLGLLKLEVEIKRTIPKGSGDSKDFKTKKVFVGGIPTSVTEDEFKGFFSKYGKVVEHEIIRDHVTKRSRGFGFIVEIKKAEPKKPSNQTPGPAYGSESRGRGYGDSYGGFSGSYSGFGSGGFGPASYRSMGSGLGGRFGDYGGYGNGSEFGGRYGDYGSSEFGYRGDGPLGYSSRFGSYGGGFGGGYGGGLDVHKHLVGVLSCLLVIASRGSKLTRFSKY